MADEISIVVRAEDNFSGVLGNFGNIMTGIKSTIDLVAGAFRGVVDFGSQFTNAAMESQNAVAELEAVLKATGGAAGLTSQELQDMASELQKVTRFGDEAIMSGQSMLLTFRNIGEDTFPRAVDAMLDMAEMFGSIDTAAVQLGKALNDPIAGIGALQRIGIQFTDEQKKMIENFMAIGDVAGAQNIILKEVEMQIGGLAEAMGTTFAGQVEILKNRFGEIQETIGRAILPILSELATALMDNMPMIERFGTVVANWITELGQSGVIQDFANRVFDLFGKLTNLAAMFVEAGVNSSEFREALSLLVGDSFQFDTSTVIGWMDQLDAAMAAGVRSHDWSESGAAFGEMLDSFMGSGINLSSQDSQAIPAIADALNRWLLGAIGAVSWEQWRAAASENLQNMLQSAIDSLADFFRVNTIQDAFRQIGIDIVAGFSAGFSFSNMVNNVRTFINNVIDYFKALLGISSPSSVFYEFGKNIVQGLILGILGMVGSIIDAIGSIVSAILEPLAPILELLGMDTTGLTGSTGGTGGRNMGGIEPGTGTGGSILTGAGVTNNFYGPVFFGDMSQLGYDCPSPHPLMTASSQSLLTVGIE